MRTCAQPTVAPSIPTPTNYWPPITRPGRSRRCVSSLPEIVEGMATALAALEIDGLQVNPYLNINPTPPTLDIYPADPFQDPEGFGQLKRMYFTIRARASTADPEAGQKVLLQLLEPSGPTSVEAALSWDGLDGL